MLASSSLGEGEFEIFFRIRRLVLAGVAALSGRGGSRLNNSV